MAKANLGLRDAIPLGLGELWGDEGGMVMTTLGGPEWVGRVGVEESVEIRAGFLRPVRARG